LSKVAENDQSEHCCFVGGTAQHEENFATIDVDWAAGRATVALRRAVQRPGKITLEAGTALRAVALELGELRLEGAWPAMAGGARV